MKPLPLTPIKICFKGHKETLDNPFGSSGLNIHRGVTTTAEKVRGNKKKDVITGLLAAQC